MSLSNQIEQAGREIINGIQAEKKTVYVPSKVGLVSFLLKYLLDRAYNRYFYWL